MYQLNLSQPIPLLIDKKQKPAPTKVIQQPFLELLMKEDRKFDIFKKFRYVVGKTAIKLSLDGMLFFSAQDLPLPDNYKMV